MRCLILVSTLALAACQGGVPSPPPAPEASWVRQSVGSEVRFQAVSAPGNKVAWLSGTNGTWARTTDGGESWSVGQVPGAESLEFRDVHGLSAEVAFLMSAGPGTDSRIYRTRDGGVTWVESFRNDNPNGFFDCMSFWDMQNGIAFSDAPDSDFLVMRTRDGGESWSRVDPDSLEDAHPGEGAFASSGTCLVTRPGGVVWFGTGASGVDSRVFRSADYGISWEATRVDAVPSVSGTSGIFTLALLDGQRGLALGGDYDRPDSTFGHGAITVDGGATWSPAGDTGLGGSVFGSTFVDGAESPTAVAVAPTGSAWSRDGGSTWTMIDAESYWAVGSSPEGDVWAVGPGGRVAKLAVSVPLSE